MHFGTALSMSEPTEPQLGAVPAAVDKLSGKTRLPNPIECKKVGVYAMLLATVLSTLLMQ
jgi:hypothetical protein